MLNSLLIIIAWILIIAGIFFAILGPNPIAIALSIILLSLSMLIMPHSDDYSHTIYKIKPSNNICIENIDNNG